jgi:PTS system glucose-specific IIA component
VTVVVLAPVAGRALPLADVPDPVFAQALVGPGAAVDPERTVVDAVAPVDGTLVKVHPHAFVVQTEGGPAVLVHLGIDTVQLGGAGFTVRVEQGQQVQAGDVVTTWDVGAVVASGRNPVVPVVLLEQDGDAVVPADAVRTGALVAAGEELLRLEHP